MRTVSFSSETVRQHLTEEFVCAPLNIEGDPSAGSSCGHAPTDKPGPCSRGVGHQNVQCLFLTSKGEIFHAASGFLSPDDLEKETAFALETFQAMKRTPAQARRTDAELHLRRLRTLGYSDADILRPRNDFFGGSGVFLFGNDAGPPLANAGGNKLKPAQGSGNPGAAFPGNATNFMDQMLAFQTKRTVLNDHKFSIEHPLMSFQEFSRQPYLLVGREKTSFSSISK